MNVNLGIFGACNTGIDPLILVNVSYHDKYFVVQLVMAGIGNTFNGCRS